MINYKHIDRISCFYCAWKRGVKVKKKLKNLKKIFNKKTIVTIIVIIALLIISLIIYFIYKEDEPKNIIYEDYTIYSDHAGKIEKYDESMTVDGYEKSENAYYITGKISAKENKDFSVITFNLYDENDKLLGTAVAGLNELEKNVVYDFKALGLLKANQVEKVDHYTLKSVELG